METIIVPHRITKAYVDSNPLYLYLYGSTVHREADMGQASIGMHCSNCLRVPVRNSLCKSSGYFSDNAFRDIKIEILVALSNVSLDGRPIIPFPKIGCGASRMKEFAPKAWAFLMEEIDKIKYPHIIYE